MSHTQTAYRKARRLLRQRWSNWRQRQRLGQSQFQVETLEPRVLLSAENLFAMTYGASGSFSAAQTVDVDEDFNSWVGGSIHGTVDLDPRGSEILRSATHTNGSAMLAKYDPAGNPLFVADFQGSGSMSNIVGVKVTDDGVYVAGNFGGSMDLDPTEGVDLVDSVFGSQDIFVLKLSHDGDLLWSATFGGFSTDTVHGLDVDAAGNVVITGTHGGSSDYDPFTGDTTGFGNQNHGFVAMIDSDGELAWSQRFVADSTASNSFAQFNGVSFDPTDGSVVAAGQFIGNITVDPDDESSVITAHANSDALLVRLNATGQLVDHYVVAGDGNEYYTDVAVGFDGHVYLAGVFTETVNLNPNGNPAMLNWDGPGSFSKPFFQAFDADGNTQGIAVQTQEGEARGITLVHTPEGYLVVGTGYFVGTADFEPEPDLNEPLEVTSRGQGDAFILVLDPVGDDEPVVANIGGRLHDDAFGVAGLFNPDTDAISIWLAGTFQSTTDPFSDEGAMNFQPTYGNTDAPVGEPVEREAIGSSDGYLARYDVPTFSSVTGNVFLDLNSNGQQDVNEPDLAGITLYLDLNGNDTLDDDEPTTVTGADGAFAFLGVDPGDYTVAAVTDDDYTITGPAGGVHEVQVGVGAGGAAAGLAFGLLASPSTATGQVVDDQDNGVADITVYADFNGNGILDDGEPSAITDAGGLYELAGLQPVPYIIRVVIPEGQTVADPAQTGTPGVHLITQNSEGNGAAGVSLFPVLSADGRYVAFVSNSADLKPDGAADGYQVFVQHLATGAISPAAVNSDNELANAATEQVAISGDGRYIVFVSTATNLAGDLDEGNTEKNVFLRDRETGEITLITRGIDGGGAVNASFYSDPSISDDGRYIVFATAADNLVEGDANNQRDVFLYDRESDTLTRILDDQRQNAVGHMEQPVISGNGGFVAFYSSDYNLIPTTTGYQAYVYDVETGDLEIASRADGADGAPLPSVTITGGSGVVSISQDGRYVGFLTAVDSLVDQPTHGKRQLYVRDRATDTTTLVSVNAAGDALDEGVEFGAVTADGQGVIFTTKSNNVHPSADGSTTISIYMRDLNTGAVLPLVQQADGSLPTGLVNGHPSVTGSMGEIIVAFSGNGDGFVDAVTPTGQVYVANVSGSHLINVDQPGSQQAAGTFVLTAAIADTDPYASDAGPDDDDDDDDDVTPPRLHLNAVVFNDRNSDGQGVLPPAVPNDRPVTGATVYLDLNNNGELDNDEPSLTDFTSLSSNFIDVPWPADNEYTIRAIAPQGYVFTTPDHYTVEVPDYSPEQLSVQVPYYFGITQEPSEPAINIILSNPGPDGSLTVGTLQPDGTITDITQVSTSYPGALLGSIVAGHFAGDGYNSVVASHLNSTSGYTRWFALNDEFELGTDGQAGPQPSTVGGPRDMVAADFDGDGTDDIAATNSSDGTVTIHMNNTQSNVSPSDRAFGNVATVNVGSGPVSLITGDFDGDGDLDLIVSNQNDNNVQLILNQGDGTFAAGDTFSTGNGPTHLAVGDFDGDGHLDVAFYNSADETVGVLFNTTGDGQFTGLVTLDPGGRVEGLQAGDMDGDGHADLVLTLLDGGQIGLFTNQGDGTFGDLEQHTAGERPTHLALVDVNNDGHLDVLVVNASLDSDEGVSILLNDGQGAFAAPVFTAMGTDVEGMTLIDLKANPYGDVEPYDPEDDDNGDPGDNGDNGDQDTESDVSLAITDITFPSAVVTGETAKGRVTFDITNTSEERLESGIRVNAWVYARPIGATDAGQDILLGENLNTALPALQPDASRSIRVNVNLPANAPAGEYEFVVVVAAVDEDPADGLQAVSDAQTFVVSAAFHDIETTVDESKVRLPDSVVSGDNSKFRVPVTVTNRGNTNLPDRPMTVRVYAVSVDDPDVRELVHTQDNVNLRNLRPDKSKKINLNFQLPPGLPDGSYTFQVVVDEENVLEDPDTSNNSVTLSNDLAVDVAEGFVDLTVNLDDARKLDPAVVAGDGTTGRIRVSVTNEGNVSLPRGQQVDVLVYLRPVGATDDSQDILVGSQSTNASNLRPDRAKRVNVNVEIPADVAEDEYQLIVAVQPGDDLTESDTDNNTQVTDVSLVVAEPFIDLVVGIQEDRVRIPDAVVSGDGTRFRMPITVQNAGNITLANQNVLFEIYALPVSEGQVVTDAQGVLVETVETTLRNLKPGRDKKQNLQFTLPPGLADGDYTFQVQVVTNNDDITANEATLDPSLAVNVAEGFVDLTVALLTDPGTDELEQGETARSRVSVGLGNAGNVNMPRQQDVDVRVYLRPVDADDDAQDILIGSQTARINNLRPDAERRVNVQVALDGTEPVNSYRLVLVADPRPDLPESDTANNTLIPDGVAINIVPVADQDDQDDQDDNDQNDQDDNDDQNDNDQAGSGQLAEYVGVPSFTQTSVQDLRTNVPGFGNIGMVTAQGTVTSASSNVLGEYDSIINRTGVEQDRIMILDLLTSGGKLNIHLYFDDIDDQPNELQGLNGRSLRFTTNETSNSLGSYVILDTAMTGLTEVGGFFEWA